MQTNVAKFNARLNENHSKASSVRDVCANIGLLFIILCPPCITMLARNNLNHRPPPRPFCSVKQYDNSRRLTPGLSPEI